MTDCATYEPIASSFLSAQRGNDKVSDLFHLDWSDQSLTGLQILVGLDDGGNKNYRENYLKATRVPTSFYKITHLFGINTLIKFAEDGRFKLVDHTLYLDLEGEDFASNLFDSKKIVIHHIDNIAVLSSADKDELSSSVSIKGIKNKNFEPCMLSGSPTSNNLLYAISESDPVEVDCSQKLDEKLRLVNFVVGSEHNRYGVVTSPMNMIAGLENTANFGEDISKTILFNLKIDKEMKCLEEKIKLIVNSSSYDGQFNFEGHEVICDSILDDEDLKELIFDNIVNPVMNLLSLIKKSNPGFHYSVKKND